MNTEPEPKPGQKLEYPLHIGWRKILSSLVVRSLLFPAAVILLVVFITLPKRFLLARIRNEKAELTAPERIRLVLGGLFLILIAAGLLYKYLIG